MYSYRRNIRGIIDELLNNALKAEATNVDISVNFDGNQVKICVEDNGSGIEKEKLEEVKKKLFQPRREELEDYYGSLAGQSYVGTGLSLVGMMTDKVEIETVPGKGTKITVFLVI